MHRTLIKWLKAVDIRVLYWFTYLFVIPPTLFLKRKEAKAMRGFFRKGFGYGRLKAWRKTFANHCSFGRVVIDRFAMYAGKEFELKLDGYEHFQALASRPEGFVQLSTHIGNYELAGYTLKAKEKRFNALVFGGEKATVMDNRLNKFERNNIRMIPLQPDMSHIYTVNQALSDGEIMSIPADRVFGSPKYFVREFLGHEAKFPQGPFQVAAMRKSPVLFVAVMKESHKSYRVIIRPVKGPDDPNATIKQTADCLASNFVKIFEKTVREYPGQWYNYYDFWS